MTEAWQEKEFGSMQGAGVTEAWQEKEFGSMQGCWSDRSLTGKGIWVNAGVLE